MSVERTARAIGGEATRVLARSSSALGVLLLLSFATSARAAAPRAFDPDGARITRSPRTTARPTPATEAPRVATRIPPNTPHRLPSVSLEPPPPPGMAILRQVRHGLIGAPPPSAPGTAPRRPLWRLKRDELVYR